MRQGMDGCVRGSGFPDWKCLYKSKNLHEKALFCHGAALGEDEVEIRSSNIRPYFKNSRLVEIRSPKRKSPTTSAAASLSLLAVWPPSARELQEHGEVPMGRAPFCVSSSQKVYPNCTFYFEKVRREYTSLFRVRREQREEASRILFAESACPSGRPFVWTRISSWAVRRNSRPSWFASAS